MRNLALYSICLTLFAHAAPSPSEFLRNGVTAHRGNSEEFPENTLLAFESAIALGVDWIETDVCLTKDRQLVLTHDKDTGRVGDKKLVVADSTYAELLTVDVAHHFRTLHTRTVADCPPARIPLLSDALKLVMRQSRTRLSLQPKDECVQAAFDVIRELKAERWVGFNDGSLNKMRQVKTQSKATPVFWDRNADTDIDKDIRTAREEGFESLIVHRNGLTREKVEKIRSSGLEVGVWTVNSESDMRRFLELGVARFYTDEPARLLRLKAEARAPAPDAVGPLHPTLAGRVLCGYQGWFRTPNDPSKAGWRHYLRQRDGAWLPLTDFLPDVSEARPEDRVRLPLACDDNGVAEVVSSDNRNTVERHFGWMRQYGIDGVLVQRFPTDMYRRDLSPSAFRESGDRVLGYCREAAAATGRSYALMYDLSGLSSNADEVVIADWRHLVADRVVRGAGDTAWQHHSGKPVIALWGVGFNDSRRYGIEPCGRLVDFFKAEGYAVLVGVPFYWRSLKADAAADARLHELLRKADIVHSWSVGRFRDDSGVQRAEEVWRGDAAWCRESKLDFMPVLFPGFSWRNLTGQANAIPRRDGAFLWSQFAAAKRAGAGCAYVAMFDEVDEGTQIFKVNNRPPKGPGFAYLDYAPLPPDHYLWLTGEATRLFRSGQPFPDAPPQRAQSALAKP